MHLLLINYKYRMSCVIFEVDINKTSADFKYFNLIKRLLRKLIERIDG